MYMYVAMEQLHVHIQTCTHRMGGHIHVIPYVDVHLAQGSMATPTHSMLWILLKVQEVYLNSKTYRVPAHALPLLENLQKDMSY